jgi:serine protease AprX
VDLVLKPDIIAPGNKVVSLDANNSNLDNYDGGTNDIPQGSYRYIKQGDVVSNDYFCLSGTSMAAPVVAGAAALLLQADPTLTPDTIKARLMLSADKWAAPDGTADALTYGAGYLNIPAALASTAKATLPALSPTLVANSDGTLSLVMAQNAWGSVAVYGSRAAWGCGLWGTGITDLRAAWGCSVNADRAHWGCSIDADRAAWGCNFISADRAAWGCSVNADRAHWGCSTTADPAAAGSSTTTVDLTSTAIQGE